MNKPLYRFFTDDHHRIEGLLDSATAKPGKIDMEYYSRFRAGLLRHIKMEERILFPAAKSVNKELMESLIPRFKAEHGALTALMVPPPDASLIHAIRFVLQKHDKAEEKPGGMYDVCEKLTRSRTQDLIDQLVDVPEVLLQSHNPAPIALEAAKRALKRAHYDYDDINGEAT